MLDLATAQKFSKNINDGFKAPHLAWSASTPGHLDNTLGSSITSNFWVGPAEKIKAYAEALARFYTDYIGDKTKFQHEVNDEESVSIAYWEADGLAMCAELCTSSWLFNVLPSELIEGELTKDITCVLFAGNDNHAGMLLGNEEGILTPEQQVGLAKFVHKSAVSYVLDNEEGELDNLTPAQIAQMKKNLKGAPKAKLK